MIHVNDILLSLHDYRQFVSFYFTINSLYLSLKRFTYPGLAQDNVIYLQQLSEKRETFCFTRI